MHRDLLIAGEHLRIVAAPEVLAALKERFGAFAHPAPSRSSSRPPIDLQIHSEPGLFSPEYERPIEVVIRGSHPDEIALEGLVRGRYSPSTRQGTIDGVTGLGAVDVLIRTALSVSLPLGGAVLLHGAALRSEDGTGIALCGASGSSRVTLSVTSRWRAWTAPSSKRSARSPRELT